MTAPERKRPMRILIPTADYPPIEGGISTVTLRLSRQLAALGHDVTVVAPRFPGQEAFDAAEPARVVRFRGYALGWFRLLPMLCAALPLAARSDLVLAINVAYGGLIGLVARVLFRVPYIAFAYAYEFLKFRRTPGVAWLLRRVYANARRAVAISEFTRGNLVAFGVRPDRVATVLPGADPAPECAPERLAEIRHRYVLDDHRVILAVGRLIPRKGHLTLVRAMPRILERFPDTVLVIVGQGPCLFEITQKAVALGVRNQVLMPGPLPDDDVAALYHACDVFALPTGADIHGQVEGFGLVFAEAHARGKPVVAGRSGGVPEAVLEGETGLLVEPGDPGAVADAVSRLFDDSALAARLGANGRKRVEAELNWAEFTRRALAAAGFEP